MNRLLSLALLVGLSLTMMACPDENNDNNDNNTTPDVTPDVVADVVADVVEDTQVDETPADCKQQPYDKSGATCAEAEAGGSCTKNADCAADERCEDVSNDPTAEVACCVKAPRPTDCKAIGEECGTDENAEYRCEELLCVGANDSPNVCTLRCAADTDCPDALPRCAPVIGYCVVNN